MFVEARQLTKQFSGPKGPVCALEQVTLQAAQGEIVGVMGPNGAGKSTLLRLLAGLLLPTQGSVHIGGVDAAKAPAVFRKQIGFAAGERPGFYDRLTGWQNLEFFAALHGFSGACAKRRIAEALEAAAMPAPGRPYQELSTGMKQRLLLARTLLHEPALFLLDEPTRSLDAAEVERFHGLMKRLKAKDRTVIFTTHRKQDVEAIADRLILLDGGRVQSQTTKLEMALAVR